MTDRRRNMVEKAFSMLDKDGSGELTISDISKEKELLKSESSWDL